MNRTLYDILGVSPGASAEAIRTAYLERIKRYHPDRAGEKGLRMTQELNAAFDILGDPDRRAAYDDELREARENARRRADAADAERRPAHSGKRPRPAGPVPFHPIGPALAAALMGHLIEALLFNFLYLARGVIWVFSPASLYPALGGLYGLALAGCLGLHIWPLILTAIRHLWASEAAGVLLADPRPILAAAVILAVTRLMLTPADAVLAGAQLTFLGGLYRAYCAGYVSAAFAGADR